MSNYIVTATSLRVRSGPGTTYAILGSLTKNTVVEGAEINGEWLHLTTPDNLVGWSHRAYLELVEETPPPPPTTGTYYRVNVSSLNVRMGPGTTYKAIGTLKLGDVVEGLALSTDGQWAQVNSTARNLNGWSSITYLTKTTPPPPPPDPTPTPDPAQLSYRVDATSLNVRQGPGTTYGVIGSVKLGDIVEGLAVSADNQWAQIRSASRNLTGWCSLTYLTKVIVPPPPGPADVLMYVTIDNLNIRSGPGDGYPVTGQVHKGEAVVYLEASPDWRWVNIKTGTNTTGWASARYLVESNDLFAAPADYPMLGLHRALSDVIPLRAEPKTTAAEVTLLKFNRVVQVDSLSADGKWKRCTNAWGEAGWYPVERLAKLDDAVTQQHPAELPWLSVAYSQYGTREVAGVKHNPRIVEYLMSTDLAEKYASLPDETDWCAAFVNWCLKKAGIPTNNSAVVNPWRSWGKASSPPQRGAVTTFLWDDGWAHVSMYLGEVGNYVICLGGNQSDAVWISVYHKKYVTSYRVY